MREVISKMIAFYEEAGKEGRHPAQGQGEQKQQRADEEIDDAQYQRGGGGDDEYG